MAANRIQVLCAALAALLIGIALGPLLYDWEGYYHSSYLMPFSVADLRYGEVSPSPGVASSDFSARVVTAVPELHYYLREYVGLGYPEQLRWLTLLQYVVAYGCVYAIGRRITGNPLGAAFALGCFVFGVGGKATLGYEYMRNAPAYEGSLGIVLALMSLTLWAFDRRKTALVLAGALANVHFTNALIAGLCVLTDAALEKRTRPWSLLADAALFLVPALPAAYLVLRHVAASPGGGIDAEAFWALMDLRKKFHVRPWSPIYAGSAAYAGLVGLAAALWAAGKKDLVAGPLLRRGWSVLGVAAVLLAANIVGVQWLRSPLIASTIFCRATVFVPPFLAAFAFAVAAAYWQQAGTGPRGVHQRLTSLGGLAGLLLPLPAIYLPLAMIIPVHTSARLGGEAPSPGRWGRWLPRLFWLAAVAVVLLNGLWGWRWFAATLVGLLVLVCWVALGRRLPGASGPAAAPQRGRPADLIGHPVVFFGMVLALLTAYAWQTVGECRQHLESVPDWRSRLELKQWATAATPPDALFLTNPLFENEPHGLGRLGIYSWPWIGMSVYNHHALEFEKTAMKEVLGVDLNDPESVRRARVDWPDGLVRSYEQLSDEDVRRIGSLYPRLRYVLAEKKYPRSWYVSDELKADDGQYRPRLSLPVAYENRRFRVYELAPERSPER